jgi:hypothetical protein
MANLIKEDRYIYFVGSKRHSLRVQELVWGSAAWPGRFRIQVPASQERDGKKFYGKSALEVVERAIEYLYCHAPEAAAPSPLELNGPN